MQSQHHEAKQLAPSGGNGLRPGVPAIRNAFSRLYADNGEMTSDKIPALGFDPSGTLRGKANIRSYWSKALQLLPNLHFEVIDTYVSPDSIVVFYRNERGAEICEYLRLNAEGKIIQGSANHLAH